MGVALDPRPLTFLACNPCILFHPAGGTRFIGLYLARQLVEEGHEVTLFTRGKKDITSMIPDDTFNGYATFKDSIRHIKGDRMVRDVQWHSQERFLDSRSSLLHELPSEGGQTPSHPRRMQEWTSFEGVSRII
jgi:hypothetical protein